MLRSSGRSFWQGSWGLWYVGVGGGACGCVGVMARHLNVVFAGMEMGLVVLFLEMMGWPACGVVQMMGVMWGMAGSGKIAMVSVLGRGVEVGMEMAESGKMVVADAILMKQCMVGRRG